MPIIALDAHDASAAHPHGSGLYVRALAGALQERPRYGHEYWMLKQHGPGPEVVWEQMMLPLMLRRRSAALVHSPNCFLPLARPCPGVVTIHDLAFEAYPGDFSSRTGLKYRTFAHRAARSADRIICPSRFTAEDVCERYGVAPDRLRVVPLAPVLPDGDAAPPEGPYVLVVGDLREKKNLRRLVGAFRRLHGEGLEHRLVLAGADLGEGEQLRRAAGDAPVELAGFVQDGHLDALMRGAALLAVPGDYEGFGLAAVEAMARGVPVALARAGALPETGGGAAAYFDPHDEDSIADVLRSVLEDPARAAELSHRGRQRAGWLSWRRTAEMTEDVYAELLAA